MDSGAGKPPASKDRPAIEREATVDPPPQIDLTSEPARASRPASHPPVAPTIGVHFTCCHVYAHLRPPSGRTQWWAHCPRCGARLAVQIDPGGSGDHFVQVG